LFEVVVINPIATMCHFLQTSDIWHCWVKCINILEGTFLHIHIKYFVSSHRLGEKLKVKILADYLIMRQHDLQFQISNAFFKSG